MCAVRAILLNDSGRAEAGRGGAPQRLRMFLGDRLTPEGPVLLFQIATVAVGVLVALLSVLSLVHAAASGGLFVNQARFLASGILLALHFPLAGWLDDWIRPNLDAIGRVEENATYSYWIATAVIVAVQLIVLPTRGELYSSYLADRLSRG